MCVNRISTDDRTGKTLPPPEAMYGAADEFPGNDYPDPFPRGVMPVIR
jgi:hypothetical protein